MYKINYYLSEKDRKYKLKISPIGNVYVKFDNHTRIYFYVRSYDGLECTVRWIDDIKGPII